MGSSNDALLGRVAVATKLLTQAQVQQALREAGRSQRRLGEILIEQGWLTQTQVDRLVDLQRQVVARAELARSSLQDRPRPRREAPPAPQPGDSLPGLERTALADTRPATSPKPEESLPLEPTALADDNTLSSLARTGTGATRPRVSLGSEPATADDRAELERLLRTAVDSGSSDLHLHSGAPIKLRRHGALYDQSSHPLEPAQVARLLAASMQTDDRASFEEHGEHDYAYELAGVARFRVNAYRQLRGIDAVFRVIPLEPPTLASLGLPSALARYTTYHQGLLLVTGPTRCGKSSTLAALVNLINEERPEHILTVEDPIEVVHPSRRCVVNQRSVRRHTESFARALRAALREDPDVIVIGELRDRETISLALTAAETGHFVLGTMHTDNSIRTLNRLVGAFAPDQQEQVRAMLSTSLKAVISQRLLPTADEQGLAVALETLVINRAVGNLLRESKTVQIRSLLQTGAAQGMELLEQSLARLVSAGRVTPEEAVRHAEDPKLIPR